MWEEISLDKGIISQNTIKLNRCLITNKHIPNKFITNITKIVF